MTGTAKTAVVDITSGEGLGNPVKALLYTNAVYLVADVAVVSIFGFAFWTIAARLYSPVQFGLASATMAAIILLARISQVGLDYGIIRFLPGAGEKANAMVNSCFTIAGLIALVAALIFIGGLNLWSPALIYIRHPLPALLFIFLTVSYTLFLIIERAFIARRYAKYVLLKNAVAGVLKVSAVVLLAFLISAGVIVVSWGLATFLALPLALFWFLPRVQPGYNLRLGINQKLIGPMLHFSLGNYIAGLLWIAPFMLFPLIVVNILGAEMNAYFYVPWIIAQTLFGIPLAVSYSLFAEGSVDEQSLQPNIGKSLKVCLLILAPAIVLLFLFSSPLLLLFGSSYSESGSTLLRILAVSAIPSSINYIGLSAMRVRKNTGWVLIVSGLSACLALGSGYFLMTRMGLTGIGVAWLATQILVALFIIVFLFYNRHRELISGIPLESRLIRS